LAESGDSAVHRMNPWTKVALLLVVVALVTTLVNIYSLLLLYAISLVFYGLGRLPYQVLIGWYTMPLVFVLSLAILFLFTEPGDMVVSVNAFGQDVGITEEGLALALTLLLRALAVVTCSLTIFMTTKYEHVAHVASRIMPKTLANIFLLTYRFVFETTDEASDIVDAMRSRGGGLIRSATREGRAFAGIFGLAFVHAFDRAETIAKAMEARGFSGEFPVYGPVARPSLAGYCLVGIGLLFIAISVYSRYISDNPFSWW